MDIPRHWRLREQRYRLIGEVCLHCDEKIFPPRAICPACGGEGVSKTEFTNEETDVPANMLVTQALLAENA